MFKWPGTPSPRADGHELADYAELVCWQEDVTSCAALSKQLGRIEENDYTDGVPEYDSTDEVIDAAYEEIERRREACNDGYPFEIEDGGYTLRDTLDLNNHRHLVYQYLLLATRLNMKKDRIHAGIDGTVLFEELAAEVAREYFGTRAKSYVFGTGMGVTDFEGKVNDLCKRINEGGLFENRSGAPPTARDGKLDIVVWKEFTDGLPSKLIGFGQCKTGTSYMGSLTELQPDSFCDKWLRTNPAVLPIRMFLTSDALSRIHWYNTARDAGLLFDRCRIVDFCHDTNPSVLKKVRSWTRAAAEASQLPFIRGART